MAKKYTIREGFSFIGDNNEVKSGGEIVELDDDVAANHAHKLELVAEPVQVSPESAAKSGKKSEASAPEVVADAIDTANPA